MKTKIAQRVIAVLDFFDERRRWATVSDFVQLHGWPQSSTSNLLDSLVQIGLLYRDRCGRRYLLTQRAAILGTVGQPPMIAQGELLRIVDALGGQGSLGVLLAGMAGPEAQIFHWAPPAVSSRGPQPALAGGMRAPLTDSAAGWLLLSTMTPGKRAGLLHRLRAEASPDRRFAPEQMQRQIDDGRRRGYAIGPCGFGAAASLVAMLLPGDAAVRPTVLGLAFDPARHDELELTARLIAVVRDHVPIDIAASPAARAA